MKYTSKLLTLFICLTIINSCSEIERDLLPEHYNVISEDTETIQLVAYDVKVFSTTQIFDMDDIIDYPKNKFKYDFNQELKLKTWDSFKNLPEKESKYIVGRLKKANNIYENKTIQNLINNAELRSENLLFAGHYKNGITNTNNSRNTFKYFYLLDTQTRKIYEFQLSF